MNLKEMLEERAEIGKVIRALADKANNEKRDFTAEEKANWEQANKDYDALAGAIERAQRVALIDGEQRAAPMLPGRENTPAERTAEQQHEDQALAIQGWLRFQSASLIPEQRHIEAAARAGIDLRAKELVIPFGRNKRAIGDAPQTVTTTGGGYLIPIGFSGMLERALLAFNPMEGVATPLVTATGQDIYWPTVNDTTAAGEMVDINTTVTEGAITFGNITFKAFKGSSKSVMVPYELMQDSAFNMETFLAETLGERLGRLRAAQCATGAGTTAPTGIITAGSSAATTASASAITADEYITLLHGVNPAYRNAAMGTSWMFNDTTAMAIRKLKDGMGQYLWQPGLSADIPDRMFGWPVIINPALANIGANAKPVVFGALRKFVIRTVGEIRIVRDPYTYSAKDQTFFVAFMRFDTNLLNAGTNPVKFLTCHA